MSLYLDINVVIALLTDDPLNPRATAALRGCTEPLLISDFGAAEYSAVVSRRVRVGSITRGHGLAALAVFEQWLGRATSRIPMDPLDVAVADSYLRRLDLPLRVPDAIHIAIAERVGASVLTFDRAMATVARTVGVSVTEA